MRHPNEHRPPQVPAGFGTSRISPFAEVPDFVIPSKQSLSPPSPFEGDTEKART